MACNQRYPSDIGKKQNTKYKTKRIFYKSINAIDLGLNVRSLDKHQLQTSVRCIAAHQRYVCYILYKIANNCFIDCI